MDNKRVTKQLHELQRRLLRSLSESEVDVHGHEYAFGYLRMQVEMSAHDVEAIIDTIEEDDSKC